MPRVEHRGLPRDSGRTCVEFIKDIKGFQGQETWEGEKFVWVLCFTHRECDGGPEEAEASEVKPAVLRGEMSGRGQR